MNIDLKNKTLLNPAEAAKLYGIECGKLRTYLKNHPDSEFILMYRKRFLIDHAAFDEFLARGGAISNAKKRR